MKYKILLSLGLFLTFLVPIALGGYEYTIRIEAKDVVDRRNNFIFVNKYNEQWLIHHKTGCGDVLEGDELIVVVRGELDGNQDLLLKGTNNYCVIDQAELITGKLNVVKVSTSDVSTIVQTENGLEYRIYYSERCKAMKGLNGKQVYVRQFGRELSEGDFIYLPGNGEQCPLTSVQSTLPPLRPISTPDPREDIKKPTTPTHFRAIPTKTGVYLYWDAATDNVGIDHYIISSSLYHTEDARVREPGELAQMPNEIPTPTNKPAYKLENLQSDELYFFRIIAVDPSGNKSPYWSQEATAFTKSSIAEISLLPIPLMIHPPQETEDTFLFRWNNIPGAADYTVILEVDGERVFVSMHRFRNYIHIYKKSDRKGKPLKLTVRTFNARGQRLQDEYKFEF